MNGVDLARFDFDYDNTWQAFFLDADLNVYGRYGGREASAPEARLSKESLVQTMGEVLEAFERRKKNPAGPAADQEVHPAPAKSKKPADFPLLKANHSGCVHCHQVQEFRLLQSFADGAFDKQLLFPFPLPENVGLRFDRDHG
ncbi:MAG: thioredoxin family protein, partial [Planctomycetota bacterium]|nr:thioredoxin family protein [Planctomycetota bacterium]